jgi:hypothetical protein
MRGSLSTNPQAGNVPEAEACNFSAGESGQAAMTIGAASIISATEWCRVFTSTMVNACPSYGDPLGQAQRGWRRFVRRATNEIRSRDCRQTT